MQKTGITIHQDIIAELKRHSSIDATHIQVAVFTGDVTLAGRVSNQAEKLNIVRPIQRVFGVKVAIHGASNTFEVCTLQNNISVNCEQCCP